MKDDENCLVVNFLKRFVAFIVLVSKEIETVEESRLAKKEFQALVGKAKRAKYWKLETSPIIEQE